MRCRYDNMAPHEGVRAAGGANATHKMEGGPGECPCAFVQNRDANTLTVAHSSARHWRA